MIDSIIIYIVITNAVTIFSFAACNFWRLTFPHNGDLGKPSCGAVVWIATGNLANDMEEEEEEEEEDLGG